MGSLKYWVWLSTRAGLSPAALCRVLDWFGSPEQVFFADGKALDELGWLDSKAKKSLSDKSLLDAAEILERCATLGIYVITRDDGAYPARLRSIPDPPLVLYVRGYLPALDEEAAVAVVGTRSATPYGLRAAERMGYELARYGCLVVSGLARGVDTAAAKGALRAGGRVVGVAGAGVDVAYPPENSALFEDVSSVGAIVSEYPPGTPPSAGNFPRRNRIMSGVSLGVVVVEAPERSGALITAACALEQGRDVFALPGNVDSPSCAGSNRLLREGAIPVTEGLQVAEEYAWMFPAKIRLSAEKVPLDPALEKHLVSEAAVEKRQNQPKKEIDKDSGVDYIDLVQLEGRLSDDEMAVLRAIGLRTLHVDEIIAQSGLSAQSVLSALTTLEIGGYVEQEKGKHFKVARGRGGK